MSEPIITLEDVDAGYGDVVILENLNVTFARGQITALLGGSGSGKSTLLKTIVGLLPPIRGKVTLLGEDLYKLDMFERAKLMRRTGMLYQYGALFGSRTNFENVALPTSLQLLTFHPVFQPHELNAKREAVDDAIEKMVLHSSSWLSR